MKDETMKAENGRIKGDLKNRTKEFAIKIIRLYSELPKRREAQVIGDQLLRSGTSVGAHFREAQRAKSIPDFVSKMEGGLQELNKARSHKIGVRSWILCVQRSRFDSLYFPSGDWTGSTETG